MLFKYGLCAQKQTEKLEKVQSFAARIVTGLALIVSRNSSYLEIDWGPLKLKIEGGIELSL